MCWRSVRKTRANRVTLPSPNPNHGEARYANVLSWSVCGPQFTGRSRKSNWDKSFREVVGHREKTTVRKAKFVSSNKPLHAVLQAKLLSLSFFCGTFVPYKPKGQSSKECIAPSGQYCCKKTTCTQPAAVKPDFPRRPGQEHIIPATCQNSESKSWPGS